MAVRREAAGADRNRAEKELRNQNYQIWVNKSPRDFAEIAKQLAASTHRAAELTGADLAKNGICLWWGRRIITRPVSISPSQEGEANLTRDGKYSKSHKQTSQ